GRRRGSPPPEYGRPPPIVNARGSWRFAISTVLSNAAIVNPSLRNDRVASLFPRPLLFPRLERFLKGYCASPVQRNDLVRFTPQPLRTSQLAFESYRVSFGAF